MLIHIASTDTSSSLDTLDKNQIQPNACDLKLDRVFAFNKGSFSISETAKTTIEKTEIFPDTKGMFRLEPKTVYEVQFEGTIKIGDDEAGWVITRSTLNRNGLFFTSGLYDSGYNGAMAGALHNNTGSYAFIAKGTRVAQFLLFKAQALHQYDGSYGIAKDGTVKQAEKQYVRSGDSLVHNNPAPHATPVVDAMTILNSTIPYDSSPSSCEPATTYDSSCSTDSSSGGDW